MMRSSALRFASMRGARWRRAALRVLGLISGTLALSGATWLVTDGALPPAQVALGTGMVVGVSDVLVRRHFRVKRRDRRLEAPPALRRPQHAASPTLPSAGPAMPGACLPPWQAPHHRSFRRAPMASAPPTNVAGVRRRRTPRVRWHWHEAAPHAAPPMRGMPWNPPLADAQDASRTDDAHASWTAPAIVTALQNAVDHSQAPLAEHPTAVLVHRRRQRWYATLTDSHRPLSEAVRVSLQAHGWRLEGRAESVRLIPPPTPNQTCASSTSLWAPLITTPGGVLWGALAPAQPLWVIAGEWERPLETLMATLAAMSPAPSALRLRVWDPGDRMALPHASAWQRMARLDALFYALGRWQWRRRCSAGCAATTPADDSGMIIAALCDPDRATWRDVVLLSTALVRMPQAPVRLILAMRDVPDGAAAPWHAALVIDAADARSAAWVRDVRPATVPSPTPGTLVVWRSTGAWWRGRPLDG